MLELMANVHAAATVFMAGVIWFVQVVHYPLFRQVDAEAFPRFQRAHEVRTTWIVTPAMTIELVAAVTLVLLGWTRLPQLPLAAGLALLVLVWSSTAFVQMPRHRILERGFDASAHRFLTLSNWLRTGAWTARAALALIMLRDARIVSPGG